MQHLDDGIIHALLDGELSTEEAEALSEHVRYCGTCADRLAEERLIQSEAERMIAELDAPAPAAAGTPLPPEALEPEPLEPPMAPEQPKSSGPPVVLMPDREFQRSRMPRVLGWAATLVVAAGAGYFASVARQPARAPVTLPEIGVPDAAAGGLLADSSAQFLDTQSMAKSVGPADSAAGALAGSQAAAGRDSAPLVIEESESEREPQAVVAEAPAPAPARDADETATRGGRREADQREAAQRAAQREAAPPPAPTPARPGEERNRSAPVRTDAAAEAPAGIGAGAPAAAAPRTSSSAPSALEQQAQIRMRIGLDETQRMLGSSLHVIDGLQQQFVGLVDGRLVQGANPNAPVVRVVYLDDQRRPIYLDQQRLDTARRQMGLARDTTPPDWVIGDVWLSLKGSLPASELSALAQRVR